MTKTIIIIVIAVTVFSILYDLVIYGGKQTDEVTEKDKTMRALRALIFLIIFLIIAGIAIKLFFWGAIVAFIKGKP